MDSPHSKTQLMPKQKLFGLTLTELNQIAAQHGFACFTGKQIAEWLYKNPVSSFSAMTNLSKSTRAILSGNYTLGTAAPASVAVSTDGTKKYLFDTGGRSVETVWIPESTRNTLCVSSQIGCRRGCRFCMTARQGFQGNLSSGEILNQYRSLPESATITNFVFMGMGEPLDNLDAVLDALEILTADWGFGFSPKRITVSTIGITDGLEKLMQRTRCRLAFSLHSPFSDERAALIPYERRYPAQKFLDHFRNTDQTHRRLTVEYLMIDGLNDDERNAKELIRILTGIEARVNLIPYHPIPDFPGLPSPVQRIEAFRDSLNRRGVLATIRRSRGLDIAAACGLLATHNGNNQI